MKSAGKARSNGLYRHIRTSKEIIRNLLNYSFKSFRVRRFDFRASFISAPKVSNPGQSSIFAILHHLFTFYSSCVAD
jgi:hypothetical protein